MAISSETMFVIWISSMTGALLSYFLPQEKNTKITGIHLIDMVILAGLIGVAILGTIFGLLYILSLFG